MDGIRYLQAPTNPRALTPNPYREKGEGAKSRYPRKTDYFSWFSPCNSVSSVLSVVQDLGFVQIIET
jgi:hypothetical protein